MELTGRITADAQVHTLADSREVTNFTLVMNDRFTTKTGEKRNVSTFVKCAYWVSSKAANHLKKGNIVSIFGRIGLDVFKDSEGEAKGTLTFHVNSITFVAKAATITETQPEEVSAIATPAPAIADDLPF